jgi:hypothetical protein
MVVAVEVKYGLLAAWSCVASAAMRGGGLPVRSRLICIQFGLNFRTEFVG